MENKRGQVTIFIIISILIILVGLFFYFLYPKIVSEPLKEENPTLFIKSCLEEELEENTEKISLQGGSISPEHYILYKSQKIEYLCYTTEYYKTCVMQKPMLKSSIEEEIKNSIKDIEKKCFEDLKKSYEKKGYDFTINEKETDVELLPEKIKITFNKIITLKDKETQRYDSITISLNNNLYELINVARDILNWEARYGDAETTIYMNFYKDLKVEKKKQSDGSTIYILTNRNSGNKFQFASRSVVWVPGYLE
jgi:hypothetical protein